ncbi:MAG: YdcF family protein [Bryobacterales bacterium]|nr:YdcF family protein [Bryobacterales bacterium]
MTRRWLQLGAIGALALGLCLTWIAFQVRAEANIDDAQAAEILIVLGAAEYRGRPSPVLEARLKHALALYQKGLARYVLTTGGAGGDPRFTESEVGRNFLISHGVPTEAIVMESEGESTIYSAVATAEIMHRMQLHSCIVVSDGYHLFRVRRILESRGMRVFTSPRPERVRSRSEEWRLYYRQAAGYLLWLAGIHI